MGRRGGWKFVSSTPFLFVSLFDWYDEEEDFEVSVFAARLVMSLIMIIVSEEFISLRLMLFLKITVNRAIHILFIFRFYGYVSLMHSWVVYFISS